jgi:hypothetical protein
MPMVLVAAGQHAVRTPIAQCVRRRLTPPRVTLRN